jgi:hypothetical protein
MYQIKIGAVIGLKEPSLEIVTGHIKEIAFLGQSQRRISPCTSNHGISRQTTVSPGRDAKSVPERDT